MLKRITLMLAGIWETVFPKRPDAKLVDTIDSIEFINRARTIKAGPHLALLPFSDEKVRACVHELKYHRNQKALTLLAGVLRKFLESQGREFLIIPIPLSSDRQRERGFNQTLLLARAASAHFEILDEVLVKTRDTRPQTKLDRRDRLSNLEGAFAVNPRLSSYLEQKHILVLDDVTTTGTTLRAAKAALLPHHPASIITLALAH